MWHSTEQGRSAPRSRHDFKRTVVAYSQGTLQEFSKHRTHIQKVPLQKPLLPQTHLQR